MRAADEHRQALHRERPWARVIRTQVCWEFTPASRYLSQRGAYALPVSAACTDRPLKENGWLLALADMILARRAKGGEACYFSRSTSSV